MNVDYSIQQRTLVQGVGQYAGAYLAGGAVNSVFTGRLIEDYDFYFKSQEAFEKHVEHAFEDGYWCVHASDRSVTFSDNGSALQYMHFEYFDTPNKVFDAFDFTVCMGAFDFDAKSFALHPTFLTDCAERRLRFHAGTRFPIISALRVLKYQARGYTISREDMLNLVLACAALDLRSWDDLDHQIGGLYGDRMAVVREGDFDLHKAIASIAARRDEGKKPLEPKGVDRAPHLSNADALINHLRELKGQPLRVDEAA